MLIAWGPMRSIPILLLTVLAVTACSGPAEDASGEDVYIQVCARCHGADLGGGVGPALGAGSEAADRTDEFLVDTITHGRGRMPSFSQTLSEGQIDRVVTYLRRVQAGT
jgi:mono/diheme cytochrome c family protein